VLTYKAWRESRTRFLLSAATLAWFCSLLIIVRPMMRTAASTPFIEFVNDSIYSGGIRNFFVIFAIVLGLGGLTQEVSRGCAPFTLALPVTRTRLLATRALVGAAEIIGLALVPTAAVLGLAPIERETYPFASALFFTTQWAVLGSVPFASAFLMSVVLSGYAALVASFVGLGVYALVILSSPNPKTAILIAAAFVPVSAMAAAIWLAERQDF
jgi:ABC-2 type transport system permease protein